jgi:hypothetical protein
MPTPKNSKVGKIVVVAVAAAVAVVVAVVVVVVFVVVVVVVVCLFVCLFVVVVVGGGGGGGGGGGVVVVVVVVVAVVVVVVVVSDYISGLGSFISSDPEMPGVFVVDSKPRPGRIEVLMKDEKKWRKGIYQVDQAALTLQWSINEYAG